MLRKSEIITKQISSILGWKVKFLFVVSESASVISLFTFNVSSLITGKASTELCLFNKSEKISEEISDFFLSTYIFYFKWLFSSNKNSLRLRLIL